MDCCWRRGSRRAFDLRPLVSRRIASEAERLAQRQRVRLAKLESEIGGELAASTLDNYDLRRAKDAKARKSMQTALDTCRAGLAGIMAWLATRAFDSYQRSL